MYISHLIDTSHTTKVLICDNKYKLSVNGIYFHMVVLFVWFAEYTSGSFDVMFRLSRTGLLAKLFERSYYELCRKSSLSRL